MRVEVEIAGVRRLLSEADAQWIHEQVANRRRDGRSVCVRIYVSDASFDLVLSTPGCAVRGRSRPARPEEQPLVDLWRELHLDQPEFTADDVVAFLRQLTR